LGGGLAVGVTRRADLELGDLGVPISLRMGAVRLGVLARDRYSAKTGHRPSVARALLVLGPAVCTCSGAASLCRWVDGDVLDEGRA
jgi:hypothetical protein